MKIENTEVYGFRAALRGMRNPKESWTRSDSKFWVEGLHAHQAAGDCLSHAIAIECPWLGPEDLKLACSLVKAGGDHRKFLRMIMVWVDLTLPRYIWTEADTYKVATVRNSCSTMHKLGSRPLTTDDFEGGYVLEATLNELNQLGEIHRANPNGKVETLRKLKGVLPESFLQKATYLMSYETALHMYLGRKDHRMREWSEELAPWILSLPYMIQFVWALKENAK